MLCAVVQSIVLYAAPVWDVAVTLEECALRVISANRTILSPTFQQDLIDLRCISGEWKSQRKRGILRWFISVPKFSCSCMFHVYDPVFWILLSCYVDLSMRWDGV